jgi:endonuclease/exonuclease/phosphatase family metal-dependent hydrolase
VQPVKRRAFLRQVVIAAALPTLSHVTFGQNRAPKDKSFHRVLSCNIRVALPEDETTGNGWNQRRAVCIDVIRAQQPDIFCLQEVLRIQMEDLENAFPNFASFGFAGPEMDARQEGYQGIAKNPIFYSKKRYDSISAGGFWLSETPHLPGSLSWGSARARHVNWVRLRDRATRREFRVLSLHLDHESQSAREQQFKMVLAEAALYPQGFPQILAGDFNAGAANPVLKLAMEAGWINTQNALPGIPDTGLSTHGFQGTNYVAKTEAGRKKGPIDFILTSGKVTTKDWRMIRDNRNGRYPSDHFFLSASLGLS